MQGFRKAFPCANISKFPLSLSDSQFWNSCAHTPGSVTLAQIPEAPEALCPATWVLTAVGRPLINDAN